MSQLTSSGPGVVYGLEDGINALLVIISTGFILLMQAGFALLENGTVREKNSRNILIKNMFDVCAGALAYWAIGYGFAFGQTGDKGGFIGSDKNLFFSAGFERKGVEDDHYLAWNFQFSFAATAATIVSGSLAERTRLPAYFLFSFLMTGFIYPVVVSWTWGGGFLAKKGFADFAGCGIVHMVGGVAGFIGAAVVGPRHGKEKDPSKKKDVTQEEEYQSLAAESINRQKLEQWINECSSDGQFEPNSFPFMVLGTILLWVSWLFFNGGSAYGMFESRGSGMPKIMMNTILAGATGGLVATVLKPIVMTSLSFKKFTYDVAALCNGILAGLVSITGVCNNVDPWAAVVIGFFGGIFYCVACKLVLVLGVDDPLEASSVHGASGMWGLIAVGLFDKSSGIFNYEAAGSSESWVFLGWQLLGMLIIVLWTSGLSLIYFMIARQAKILRVTLLDEVLGLDISEMGASKPKMLSQVEIRVEAEAGITRVATLRRESGTSPTKRVTQRISHDLKSGAEEVSPVKAEVERIEPQGAAVSGQKVETSRSDVGLAINRDSEAEKEVPSERPQ